jgi:hypothetical protein
MYKTGQYLDSKYPKVKSFKNITNPELSSLMPKVFQSSNIALKMYFKRELPFT